MITFFTHCRAFDGEFDKLQKMAIESWIGAVPGCQVILMGDERGTLETAERFGVGWLSVHTNSNGTALVSDIFNRGWVMGYHDLLCEISSDIVLGADLKFALDALREVEKPFVVGQRWDIDQGAKPETAVLHPPSAVDYFLFRRDKGRDISADIPPFAIGRTAYDNWLIWAAIHLWDMTVIDATEAITAIHVNHGYPEYGDKQKMLQSEERAENHRLAKATGCDRWYGVNDAPNVMVNWKVKERA